MNQTKFVVGFFSVYYFECVISFILKLNEIVKRVIRPASYP
jgi:hypothetical protein